MQGVFLVLRLFYSAVSPAIFIPHRRRSENNDDLSGWGFEKTLSWPLADPECTWTNSWKPAKSVIRVIGRSLESSVRRWNEISSYHREPRK